MIFYDICDNDKFKEVELADNTDWEGIICPKYDGHQRAGNRIGDLKVELMENKYSDFLWTHFSDCIINDKITKIFKENQFTGYELKPVKVQNIKMPYGLWELVVTGKGGEAHKDSEIYLKEKCDYCGLKVYSAYENGIIVNEQNWDGSDIFTVVGYPKHYLVTERVKNLIITDKLIGIKITPSNELRWPKGVIKP